MDAQIYVLIATTIMAISVPIALKWPLIWQDIARTFRPFSAGLNLFLIGGFLAYFDLSQYIWPLVGLDAPGPEPTGHQCLDAVAQFATTSMKLETLDGLTVVGERWFFGMGCSVFAMLVVESCSALAKLRIKHYGVADNTEQKPAAKSRKTPVRKPAAKRSRAAKKAAASAMDQTDD